MQRAYNPQTGEYVFLVDNQWVKPTQSARNPQTGELAFLVANQWQVVPGEKPTERTWGEAAKDIAAGVVSGAGSLVQLPGQLYGLATGDFSETGALGLGKDIAKYGEEMKSAGLKAREEARRQKIKAAEQTGQWEAFKTAFGETVTDPALLTSFLAEQAPQLLVPFGAARIAQIGTAGKAAAASQGLTGAAAEKAVAEVTKAAAQRGTTAAIGAGATQQGADVGAKAYEDIYKELISKGANPEDAVAGAINLARAAGASGAIISLLAQRLPGARTLEEAFAGVPGTGGRLLGAAKGALGEGASEIVEETGGKFGANLAMREVKPEQSLLEGLGETAGMAAVGGVGIGGVTGALRRPGVVKPEATTEAAPPTTGAPTAPPVEPKPPGYQELYDKLRGMRMSPENADLLARQMLAEQQAEAEAKAKAPAATPAGLAEQALKEAAPEGTQKRVAELTQEYIDSGVPPQEAVVRATEQALKEAEADATAETVEEGAPSATEPVKPTVGEGVPVAGKPGAGAPAEGVGVPPTSGVVPPVTDVGRPVAGAAEQPRAITPPTPPAAVTEKPASTPAQFEKETVDADGKTAAFKYKERPWRFSPRAVGQIVTFTDQGKVHTGTITEVKDNTGGTGPTEILRVTDNDPASARDDNGNPIPEKWTLGSDQIQDVRAPTAAVSPVTPTTAKERAEQHKTQRPVYGEPQTPERSKFNQWEKEQTILDKEAKLEGLQGRDESTIAWNRDWEGDTRVRSLKEARAEITDLKQRYGLPESFGLPTPAAPVTPPTKRGRKPLPPEQKAASEERRAGQRKEANAAAREVEQLGRNLEEALKPLDETQFPDEQALAEARADKQREKVKALRDLFDFSKANRNKPGQRATELLNNPAVTPKERADIEAGYRLRQKAKGKIQPAQIGESAAPAEADSAFRGFTNATQALSHIAKTGSEFQKFLANRLRSSTTNVKFVVVEKGDPTPEALTKGKAAEAWERARGLFVRDDATGARTVYVRGDSFGADQGANNVTVLHEILHAATVQKLYLGLRAGERGFSPDAQVTKATRELVRVMRVAQDEFLRLNRRGQIPPGVAAIYEATDGEVFGDPREFLAYGMSDPDIQNFLNSIEDVAAAETFFSRFVDAIRDFFGIGEDQHTAMTNLVNVTDKLLKAKVAGDLKFLEKQEQKDAQKAEAGAQKVSAEKKERKKRMSAAERKIMLSRSAQDVTDGIGILTTLRNPKLLMDALGASAETLKIANLKALLPALQTNIIAEWGDKLGIKGLSEVWRDMQDMSSMRNNTMIASSEITQKWLQLQPGVVGKLQGKKSEIEALADVMHYSTDRQIDPTKSTRDPKLNEMWNALSPKAKELYVEVRDFYRAQYDLYRALLDKRIAEMNIPGEVNDPDTPKGRLMADIKKMYEGSKKIEPYFPLMRYGDYWLRVGSGKNSAFYMFESPYDREMFLRKEERRWKSEGRTPDIEKGNSLEGLRKNTIQANDGTLLKQIFETLDEPGAGRDVEALKDQIYQLYLTTMPEQSFRKQFIHRTGRTGFSGDALRNFVTSSVNMANQLARLQYGPRLMNSITRASKSLEGMPNKDKLDMLVHEMEKRVEMEVYPDVTNPFLNTAANIANKSAFLYFMTSVKTALSQLASLPVFGAPVLFSRHNPVQVVKEMSRFMLLFNEFGTTKRKEDGSLVFVAPTVAESRLLTDEEKRAIEEMHDRGLAEVTLTYDLMDRKATPTTKYTGAWQATTNAMGALFHHTERINREVMYLTAFRLSRNEGKSFQESVDQAVKDTYDALGNFTAQNRPRVMRSPAGRVLLQFKTFPAFVTTYLVRNMYRMTKDMDPAARKEARIQFFGTLGMSFALAGYVGIPGASFAFGVAQSLINALKDEDDEDPIEKRNLELWFRTVFLPNMFGDFKIGDKKLGEILEAGLLNSMTGYDVSSSMNMNNMWFPDVKESATYVAGVQEYLMSMAGPFASLALKQFPAAIDDFQAGRTMRGFEKLLPNLFRQPVTAARYAEEGATTTTGAYIREAEEFTKGQLAMQALGFRTEGLARAQEMNFKAEALRQKVIQQRGKLINRLDTELAGGDDAAADKVMEDILEFNYKNPAVAIEADMLSKSLLARARKRAMSDRGFRVEEKLYPQLVELLDPSRELLEREAAK